eukprot:CAMPEP_0171048694 /NCGR_PEP_ID=MMETSP0736-20130129/51172_1 /TAXON_ID=186038 /ORGANISM="Fragilariopsis kerguelensis, Strain L26-C5" /LENGTH=32 /DNA_ID= /DNA_START= /DNA_END= /DNA_ORIENTATION=
MANVFNKKNAATAPAAIELEQPPPQPEIGGSR